MRRIHRLSRPAVLATMVLAVVSCDSSSTDVDSVEITTTSLPNGAPGLAYATTLAAAGADGGPYAWELAAESDPLPEGLDLATDGAITGIPLLNGTSSFTVEVSTDGLMDEAEFSITVVPNCHVADCAGLQGYWRFDEASLEDGQEVADGSGENRVGVVVTDDAIDKAADGRVDGAMQLDGADDHVTVADNPGLDLDADFTLMAWINPDAVDQGYQALVSKSAEPTRPASLWLWNDRIEVWYSPGGNQASSTEAATVTAGAWTHVAATYDEGAAEIQIYIDGALVHTVGGVASSPEINDAPLALGQRGDDGFHYGGALDEVMVWSRALDGEEIGDIYDATN